MPKKRSPNKLLKIGDLVFYHCRLKFYLLIDLKVGELTHADVGQMDGYVRMYDGAESGTSSRSSPFPRRKGGRGA